MSVVQEKKRGTIPLGKRLTPQFDRDLDHPLSQAMNEHDLHGMCDETVGHVKAYLRIVTNPSLDNLQRYVLQQLRDRYANWNSATPAIFETIRWVSQLPNMIQRIVNMGWAERPRQTSAVVRGRVAGLSL